ncbi:MAG: hypothetical protein EOP64_00750 [Sphingomonas sp.]|nr:MAG: hypothetical protein EOP64_00750 [Sphingomonas sp.]
MTDLRKAALVMRGVLAALFIWLICASTIGIVLARKSPAASFALGYHTAAAEAAIALAGLAAYPGANDKAIARHARAALRREAINVDAVVALGTITALTNHTPAAERMFAYAEQLSRRNIPTQLWLIENAVQQGEIEPALAHYDRAMTVSVSTRALLLPVLATAAASPTVARPLARLLVRRPLWWPAAIEQFIASPDPVHVLPPAIAALRLRPDVPEERAYLVSAMKRLADAGAAPRAYALYRAAQPASAAGALLRAGNFEKVGDLPPFDWNLADGANVSGVIQPGGVGSGSALFLSAEGGGQGEVARQVLLLPTATYGLTATTGNVPQERIDRPRIVISCLSSDKSVLLDQPFATSGEHGAPVAGTITVPGGCTSQLIQIVMHASLDGAGAGAMPWIDNIQIAPTGAR